MSPQSRRVAGVVLVAREAVGGRHRPHDRRDPGDAGPGGDVGRGGAGAVLGDDGPLACQCCGHDPEQLDTVGFCQYPWSDAAELPFISVVWAGNLEFIHHMAEIALLRDLYRTRPRGAR